MSIWEQLEIERTTDLKQIKKAYAKKMKIVLKAGNDAEFQALKEAYDLAVKWAKSGKAESQESRHVVLPKVEATQEFHVEKEGNHSQLPTFIEAVVSLIKTNERRQKITEWELLLKDKENWSIPEYVQYREFMMRFLIDWYIFIPKKIIRFLINNFELIPETEEVASDSLSSYFRVVSHQIINVPNFSFAAFSGMTEDSIFEFCRLRYTIYQKLTTDLKDENITELYSVAIKLNEKDTDLINLYMLYLVKKELNPKWQPEEYIHELDSYLIRAKENQSDNEVTIFIDMYYQAITTKSGLDQKFLNAWHDYYIPTELAYLMTGYIYDYNGDQITAVQIWKNLPNVYSVIVQKKIFAVKKTVDVEVKEKKEKKQSYNVVIWLAVFVVIGIFIAGITQTKKQEPDPDFVKYLQSRNDFSSIHKEYREKFQENSWGTEEETNNESEPVDEATLLDDQKFIYYFLMTNDAEKRQMFIDQSVAEVAKAFFLEHINDAPAFPRADFTEFRIQSDYIVDFGKAQLITYSFEQSYLLQVDENDKIMNVLAKGWTETSTAEFQALVEDIHVRPETSTNFFVMDYLLSENQKESLQVNSEYVTKELYGVLEKNASGATNDYDEASWQLSKFSDGRVAIVVNDNNGEHRYILSFDRDGRLEHIYSGGWEQLDLAERQFIYDNCEEKENFYTF